jgi:hypothetical protein
MATTALKVAIPASACTPSAVCLFCEERRGLSRNVKELHPGNKPPRHTTGRGQVPESSLFCAELFLVPIFILLFRYYVEDSGSRLILATEELASKVHPLNREVS